MIPYALIGKAVVGIIVVCLFIVGVVAFVAGVYAAWYKGLTFISNMIWRNYDVQAGEQPPQKWRKVSAFVIMLRDNDFDKKDEVWETIQDGGW